MANPTLIAEQIFPSSSVKHQKRTRRWQDWATLIILLLFLMVMLLPLVIITMNAFKTEDEYYATGALSLPQSLNMNALQKAWESTDYATKLTNSAIISLSTAALAVGLSLFNAFALGIGRIRGRTFVLLFFLLATTVPAEALAYPIYYIFKQVGLYNTRTGVILLSAALNSAFGTYLLSSVFSTFPKELIEAAVIDGANKLQLLRRILIPLNIPTLSVLFVFFFIGTWNDFFLPLILLISNAKQTVPVALSMASAEHSVVITSQSAAALLGIVPCIIFFFLFQRSLTRGITAGSVK
ncbi:MAG: carbohydrate ABC transporter permease [Chloroflexota bacterium]